MRNMADIKQANTKRRPSVVLMQGQRRRRWTSIKTTRGRHLVLAGIFRICAMARDRSTWSSQPMAFQISRSDTQRINFTNRGLISSRPHTDC